MKPQTIDKIGKIPTVEVPIEYMVGLIKCAQTLNAVLATKQNKFKKEWIKYVIGYLESAKELLTLTKK